MIPKVIFNQRTNYILNTSYKDKKVYVIGGQEKSRAGVEVYSIELNQWTQLQTAPRIQYMAACGLANSKIFMIGGWITDSG